MPPCGTLGGAHGPSLHTCLTYPSAHLPCWPRQTLLHSGARDQEFVTWGGKCPRSPTSRATAPVVVDRRQTPRGELVLRRAGEHFEVIANGTFLMDTRDGRSERALVREAIAGRRRMCACCSPASASASRSTRRCGCRAVAEVVVVELEPAVVEWARTHLRGLTRARPGRPARPAGRRRPARRARDARGQFDAICLDIDNGPGWLVHDANAGGLRRWRPRSARPPARARWPAGGVGGGRRRPRSRHGCAATSGPVRAVSIPVAARARRRRLRGLRPAPPLPRLSPSTSP